MSIRSDVAELFADDYTAAVVDCNRDLMKNILFKRYLTEEARGVWREKRVYLIPHDDWGYEKYTVRGDNAKVLSLPDSAQLLY